MAATQHLQPLNLRDQAIAELRARLISGDLKPGLIYSAAAIAADLGISSGPVREAMLLLVNQGMMETVRNKGFRVVELTARDRLNIAEMRKLVEIPSMVKLAGSPHVADAAETFRDLANTIVDCARENDLPGYLEADRAFHLGLLELLGNTLITQSIESLRDHTRQYGLHTLATKGQLVSSAEEHHAILDALIAGDGDLVQSRMTAHLNHLSEGWSAPDYDAS